MLGLRKCRNYKTSIAHSNTLKSIFSYHCAHCNKLYSWYKWKTYFKRAFPFTYFHLQHDALVHSQKIIRIYVKGILWRVFVQLLLKVGPTSVPEQLAQRYSQLKFKNLQEQRYPDSLGNLFLHCSPSWWIFSSYPVELSLQLATVTSSVHHALL